MTHMSQNAALPSSPPPRIGVVLMNLGGPKDSAEVFPFLYSLFADPAILRLPTPFRQILAGFIAWRRTPKARGIYDKIGGGSPLYTNTLQQAQALGAYFTQADPSTHYHVTLAMRHAAPGAAVAAQELATFGPQKILLLPLYPQYSTTTTASSVVDIMAALARQGLGHVPVATMYCYPQAEGFAQGQADRIFEAFKVLKAALKKEQPHLSPQDVRFLFSAHGLPQRVVDQGDPYPEQVLLSTLGVVQRLREVWGTPVDFQLCYQSKVGPLAWLRPALDEALEQAAQEGKGVMVVPISFVSEHSETLVELDMDYKDRAAQLGLPFYSRAATVGTHGAFIEGLGKATMEKLLSWEAGVPQQSFLQKGKDGACCPERSAAVCPCLRP